MSALLVLAVAVAIGFVSSFMLRGDAKNAQREDHAAAAGAAAATAAAVAGTEAALLGKGDSSTAGGAPRMLAALQRCRELQADNAALLAVIEGRWHGNKVAYAYTLRWQPAAAEFAVVETATVTPAADGLYAWRPSTPGGGAEHESSGTDAGLEAAAACDGKRRATATISAPRHPACLRPLPRWPAVRGGRL